MDSNSLGAHAVAGQLFVSGAVLIMERCSAKADGETRITGVGGHVAKEGVAKVPVMASGKGWGHTGRTS